MASYSFSCPHLVSAMLDAPGPGSSGLSLLYARRQAETRVLFFFQA